MAGESSTPGPPAAGAPAPAPADPKPAPKPGPPPGTPPAPPPAAKGAAPASPTAAGTPQTVEAAKGKLEAAGGDVPAQKTGETDADYEVRLSRLTRELKHTRAQLERSKVDQQQLKSMKEELEKAKNKRISKKEFIQLVKDLDGGKLQLDDDEWAALPPAIRDRITKLESAEQERQREREEREQGAQRVKEEGIVLGRLKEIGADLPLFGNREGIEKDILDIWYERFSQSGVKPDLDQVAMEAHAGLAATLARALQSAGTRQFLLRSFPDLKSVLTDPKAMTSSPPSDAKGSAAANGRAADPAHSAQDAPTRPLSRFEEDEAKRARILARAHEVAAEIRAKKEAAAHKG